MNYEIQTKHDISGVKLVVRFPEKDLDYKALYTIQAYPPDFLVPIHYHVVNDVVECTYEIGNRSKLQYRFGSRTPKEYMEFWHQVLQPLLDCSDWFMKPSSFVFDIRYLYIDKDGEIVSYIYIPSKQDCAESDALKIMVTKLSDQNPVTDPVIENKVLKTIIQDFQPKNFLEMLRESISPAILIPEAKAELSGIPVISPVPQPEPLDEREYPVVSNPPKTMPDIGDIDIKLDAGGKSTKKKVSGSLWGKKKKPEGTPKKKGIFSGKEEKRTKEIIMGAGAKNENIQRSVPIPVGIHPFVQESEIDDPGTQLDPEMDDAYLRLASAVPLPKVISVAIEPGRAFTIGRFDVSVGHKQSDFEFEQRTKAVSRRHAAIERSMDGSYIIVDLSSRAGTFVNGEKLAPNVPCPLERGYRVSFGTGGADYIWEC